MSSDLQNFFFQQIRTAEHESGKVHEAVIGVVTDNKDPDKLGRVKVKIPVLSDKDATWWAQISMMGAGKNRGWFFIPEIDDEVLVMFAHGDMESPVVIGALWGGKDKPPDKNPGGNPRRVIKSRAGSKVVFDDEKEQLVIEDGKSFGRITFDAKANKVTLESLQGDVAIQAPQGEVLIKGADIEMTAGTNLEVHAGSDIKYGGATIKMNGSTVSYGSSQINVNNGGSGPASVEGTVDEIADPYGS
jgi:uncharacterized protein involved in type VI secretion and phage assembly